MLRTFVLLFAVVTAARTRNTARLRMFLSASRTWRNASCSAAHRDTQDLLQIDGLPHYSGNCSV